MRNTRIITAACAIVAASGLVLGAAALANASAPAAATASYSAYGGTKSTTGGGGHTHTPVTGTELASVTAAVKAKDSAVTVTSVRKDPDGSYDVLGTKAGASVMLEVSKDLRTITTREGRGPGGRPTT